MSRSSHESCMVHYLMIWQGSSYEEDFCDTSVKKSWQNYAFRNRDGHRT